MTVTVSRTEHLRPRRTVTMLRLSTSGLRGTRVMWRRSGDQSELVSLAHLAISMVLKMKASASGRSS
eukprot:scaffold7055_cov254-Pinguiococcus_pyrenoidosus.AAC.4